MAPFNPWKDLAAILLFLSAMAAVVTFVFSDGVCKGWDCLGQGILVGISGLVALVLLVAAVVLSLVGRHRDSRGARETKDPRLR